MSRWYSTVRSGRRWRLREQGWRLRQPGVLFGQAPLAPEAPDADEEQAATA